MFDMNCWGMPTKKRAAAATVAVRVTYTRILMYTKKGSESTKEAKNRSAAWIFYKQKKKNQMIRTKLILFLFCLLAY